MEGRLNIIGLASEKVDGGAAAVAVAGADGVRGGRGRRVSCCERFMRRAQAGGPSVAER